MLTEKCLRPLICDTLTPKYIMAYFYDLSLIDARGELTSALTVLHYGNEIGAFAGPDKTTINLDTVFAVEVDLTAYASSPDGEHSYALMFFERNWDHEVWQEKLLEKRKNLKAVTTRVTLTADMTNNPSHEHHLFTASNRYIDFADYPDLAMSHCVPAEYVEKFNKRFKGYLMRSERKFADVRSIFKKYQLADVVDHNYDVNDLHEHVKVSAYVMEENISNCKNAIA